MAGGTFAPGDKWMGFAFAADEYKAGPAPEGTMSPFVDGLGRQWMALPSRYSETTWGGLVSPAALTLGKKGKDHNKLPVLDGIDSLDYAKGLYKDVTHVRGQGNNMSATWRINSGSGRFHFSFHTWDPWSGGKRRYRFSIKDSTGLAGTVVTTPSDGKPRVDQYTVQVTAPAATFDVKVFKDDTLPGDNFPTLCGFEISRVDDESLIQRSAIILGKAAAGSVRFFAEDCYNSMCQGLYLCKMWRDDRVSDYARIFTILSIAAGVACSASGPLLEAMRLRALTGLWSSPLACSG